MYQLKRTPSVLHKDGLLLGRIVGVQGHADDVTQGYSTEEMSIFCQVCLLLRFKQLLLVLMLCSTVSRRTSSGIS